MSLQIKHAIITLIPLAALFYHDAGISFSVTVFNIEVAPCSVQTLNSGTAICNVIETR